MIGEHVFTLDLAATSPGCRVFLDGEEITALVRGARVTAAVGELTRLELDIAYGRRVELTARLPEAQVVLVPHPQDPAR